MIIIIHNHVSIQIIILNRVDKQEITMKITALITELQKLFQSLYNLSTQNFQVSRVSHLVRRKFFSTAEINNQKYFKSDFQSIVCLTNHDKKHLCQKLKTVL